LVQRLQLAARLAALALVFSAVASGEPGGLAEPLVEPSAEAEMAPSVSEALADEASVGEGGPSEPGLAPADRSPRVDRVVEVWRAAPPTPHARSAALRRLRLEYGLGDLSAPALVVQTASDADEPEMGTELALELAPAMPALGWAHVKDLWRGGAPGEAIRAFGSVLASMSRDLESQLWLIGNGLLFSWMVALVSASALIGLLAIKAFPHAAHDLGDPLSTGMPAFARAALLAGLLMVPLVLGEGLAGLVLAAFAVAFVYGTSRERSALGLAAIAWIVALHPLAQWASVAATVADLDPITRSAWAVTKGTASRADVERLEAAFGEDVAAAHAIAYHARRQGDTAASLQSLDALVARYPSDSIVLANRGNLEMRAGRTDEAIRLYERAAAQSNSPALLFDLSQAYATVLRMDESERVLARAQNISDGEVAALSSLSEPRLVADVGFPIGILRDRLKAAAVHELPTVRMAQRIAPGRMGEDWQMAGGVFGLVALLGLFSTTRFDRSSVCSRCGHRICTRCDETVWSDELCDDCHHLFKNSGATDARLRMARLQVLSRRDARRNRLIALGSIFVPGVAGLANRRPDAAFFALALFVWLVAWARWPAGILVDSSRMGDLASLCFSILGAVALASYAALVVGSFLSRRNR
jgi:tetratricopeptide (TPR) repeat protein